MSVLRSYLSRLVNLKPTMYSGSLILNLLGMQWWRITFFRLRYLLRFPMKADPTHQLLVNALERDGVLIVTEFLPSDEFSRVREEYDQLSPHFALDHSEVPVPRVERLNVHDARVSDFFRERFAGHPLIMGVAQLFLNRRYHLPVEACLTRISCGSEDITAPKNGGTNNLHFDAPLRVLKGFYYLNDTTERNAALRYCRGTQKRNTFRRLLFEYRLSVRYAFNRWNHDTQGEYRAGQPWVRVSDDEVRIHKLDEEPVSVRANTLVLVDTGGFHRRGDFLEPSVRKTVELNFRNIESLRNDLHPLIARIRRLL